jgi:hypothetical protein
MEFSPLILTALWALIAQVGVVSAVDVHDYESTFGHNTRAVDFDCYRKLPPHVAVRARRVLCAPAEQSQ